MESLLSGISHHGYTILFVAVFLEAIGVPVPAAIALLLAGGASASGSLSASLALTTAFSAMILWSMAGFACGTNATPPGGTNPVCTNQGVAHFAHLGGMLGGYLMIRAWRSHSLR